MNLESQVCSLDLAKRLKELGVKQDSLFYWIKEEDPYIWYNSNNYPLHVEKYYYSAFTATELLDMLPYYIDTKVDEPFNFFRMSMTKSTIFDHDKNEMQINYLINYLCETTETGGENAWLQRKLFSTPIYDKNLANAAAKVLIYLIESGLITTPLPGALQDG